MDVLLAVGVGLIGRSYSVRFAFREIG